MQFVKLLKCKFLKILLYSCICLTWLVIICAERMVYPFTILHIGVKSFLEYTNALYISIYLKHYLDIAVLEGKPD